MLTREVLEAVQNEQFHIWAVDHVDQGIEVLTGIPAGERNEDGEFPEGTINYLVDLRLEELASGLKEYEGGPSGEEPKEESEEQAQSETLRGFGAKRS